MKKCLLQDASNAGLVKAQEARTKPNSVNAQVHLQAYPELSSKPRASIDIQAAEASNKKRQVRRLCHDIVMSTVESAFEQLALECDVPMHAGLTTNQPYNTMTWKERSVVIFYYLHPSLGNMDADVTCRVFRVRYSTFTNWVAKHSYHPKWIPFLENMAPKTVLQPMPADFRKMFDVSELDLKTGVVIPLRFRTPPTKRFLMATSHPQISRQKAVKIAKKSEGVKYSTASTKTVTHGRSLKYPWESGNPISQNEIYLRLIQQFGNVEESEAPSEFCSIMKLSEGGISPALAPWVRRRLEVADWSIRMECVSQMVPTDWVAIALEASQKIRAKLKACTVLINADEMFIKFFS